MKFYHFFIFYLFAFLIALELWVQKIFSISSFHLFNWWIDNGRFRLPVIFLLGLSGLVFVIFVSSRSFEIYISLFGKKESYIFLGDKLSMGFFGHLTNDKSRTIRFIPSFLDSNVYPASSFHSLYTEKNILDNGKGEYVKLDFFYLGNLILWTIFHLFMGLLSLLGFLLYMLDYYYFLKGIDTNKINLPLIYNYINNSTSNSLQYYYLGMIVFYILSILLIRLKLKPNELFLNKSNSPLPESITHGNIILGKIIASTTNIITPRVNEMEHGSLHYRQYAIEFDEKAGFIPSVCINFSLQDIKDANINNAIGKLKTDLIYQKEYFDICLEELQKAETSSEYFPFYIDKDLCLFPYIEEHKTKIPKLLTMR